MDDTGLDLSAVSLGCDAGLSFGGDLSFPTDLGISSENCFQNGDELSFQQPEVGQLAFPNRLARQLVQLSASRTNRGGVVLAPAGLPLQTLGPTQQVVNSSMTALNNPGYQAYPGYHPQPVNIQQPSYNGAAVISASNGFPMQTVQPTPNHVQQTVTVVNTGMPVQRQGAVVVPQIPPPNWMGLSIFSVIFCTLPFGIIAFIFSFLVNDSYRRGDYQKALKNSNIAKWLNVLAVISGLPLGVFIIYVIIRGM